MEKEYWKDIPTFNGIYQASTQGKIRDVGHHVITKCKNHTTGKVYFENRYYKPKILRQELSSRHYMRIRLTKNGKTKKYSVHRLILATFKPKEFQKYSEVNHKNFNTTDNRISNLEGCTAEYNDTYGNHGKHIQTAKGFPFELIKGKQKRYFIRLRDGEKYLKNHLHLTCKLKSIGDNINRLKHSKTIKHVYGYRVKFL